MNYAVCCGCMSEWPLKKRAMEVGVFDLTEKVSSCGGVVVCDFSRNVKSMWLTAALMLWMGMDVKKSTRSSLVNASVVCDGVFLKKSCS